MKKVVIIESRYGDKRYLEQLSPTEYIIWGDAHYMRFSPGMIDFEGGPIYFIGKSKINGKTIINIEPYSTEDKPNCYKLTVE